LSLIIVSAASCSRDPEVTKRKYVSSGDRYNAAKKYTAAAIEYRNALAVDPAFGEARFKLAKAYIAVDQQANALREAVRAADLMPKDPAAQLLAGKLLLAVRRNDDAKARALATLALEPKNVEGLLLLGNAMAGLRDLDGAIERVEEAIEADPRATFAYTNLGLLEIAKGNKEAAETALKRVVEIDPKSVPGHLSLGNFYWALGRRPEAEREVKTAADLDPSSAVTNRAVAAFYMTNGDLAQAEQYLKKFVAAAPTPDNKVLLADFLLRQGRTDEASPVLEALNKDGFLPAAVRLAQIDYRAGRKDEAYNRVDALLKKDPRSQPASEAKARFLIGDRKYRAGLQLADAIIQANPKAIGAFYLKGLALEGLWAREEAIKAFREMLKIDPASIPAQLKVAQVSFDSGDTKTAIQYAGQVIRTRPILGARVLLARALIRDGKVAQAENDLLALAKAVPTSSDVQSTLGSLYLRKRDAPRARQAFNRALELQPDSTDAVAGLTALDVGEKKPAVALARLERQLAARPDDVTLLSLAANTYFILKRSQDAENAFTKIIAVDQNNLPAYRELALLYVSQRRLDEAKKNFEDLARRSDRPAGPLTMIGMILMMQNNLQEARKQFSAALGADPNMPIAANNLAWLYAEGGDNLDSALKLAQTAKVGLPNSADVSDTLGWIYYKKGLASLAIASLQEATRQNPKSPDIHYRLGLAYLANKNNREARQSLEHALKLNPKFSAAEDAKRTLASIS
jgi:tetratricopeptide (TPR) repeat protein